MFVKAFESSHKSLRVPRRRRTYINIHTSSRRYTYIHTYMRNSVLGTDDNKGLENSCEDQNMYTYT